MDYQSSNRYATFSLSGKSHACYGLSVVADVLRRRGLEVDSYRTGDKRILFSLYWPEQIYEFIRWRKREGLSACDITVGGNTATANPAAILPFSDRVFLGDGECWDGRTDHKNIVDCNTSNPADIAVAKQIIPRPYEDVQDNRRSFIEISRGCRNKCLFCQYGWLKPYREADLLDIAEAIKVAKTKSVRLFAADRFQHAQYKKISSLVKRRGLCDTGSDASLRFILKNQWLLQNTKKIRMGIEGMSARLRSVVGKPCSDDEILSTLKIIVDNGIKCLDWYMIYGLPTETEDDVSAFISLLKRLPEALPHKYTIAIHWNAFQPNALTPLQWSAAAFGYDKDRLLKIHKTMVDGITIYHKPLLTSDERLISRMLAVRGSFDTANLVFGVATKPNLFKTSAPKILAEYKRITGLDLCGEWPKDRPMPHDQFVAYDRDQLLRIANRLGTFCR